MFVISISDILASYTGDSKKFSFSGEIFDGYMEDLIFRTPLEFSLQIIALDDGVEVIFDTLHTEVSYEWKVHQVSIANFSRTWKKQVDPLLDDDDIRQIDTRNMTIDLTPVLREEIIMACYEL